MTSNNDHHMKTPISSVIPIPTMVIQLPLPQPQYIIHQNASCVYCGQHNQSHANDKGEEKKENNEVIYIKSDEFLAYFDVGERVFNQDVNMYSPISFTDTSHEEKRELSFDEIQDQFFDNLMKTCFDDIAEVVEYLKEDISLM